MRAFLVAVTLIGALAGCELITHFDPESQPCDANAPADQQCLPDFHCENGLCKKGAFAGTDGGVDAGP